VTENFFAYQAHSHLTKRRYRMDQIDICLEVLYETEKAFLVSDNDGESSQWIPKSKIDTDPDAGVGDTVVIKMPLWLAENKGFV